MPWDEVMHKFKTGNLNSGSKSGPPVKNRKQAIAIMLSEKRKAGQGNTEYQPLKPKFRDFKSSIKKPSIAPTSNFLKKFKI